MAFLYPWGNTQQLNLDWILQKIKELESGGGGGGADIEEIANVLVALTYRSANTYQRYDYAFYNGKLYRATANTTGAFNPAVWLEVQIGNDVAILTRQVNALDTSVTTLLDQMADLDSDDVDNASTVTGNTVSDALNNLNGAITSDPSNRLKGKKVAIYGDSWASDNYGKLGADYIATITGVAVHKKNFGGATLDQIRRTSWDSYNSDIYIIEGGLNDASGSTGGNTFITAITDWLSAIRAVNADAEIYFVTPPYVTVSGQTSYLFPIEFYRLIMWRMAAKNKFHVINALKWTNVKLLSDNLHPTTDSYEWIGKYIVSSLINYGDEETYNNEKTNFGRSDNQLLFACIDGQMQIRTQVLNVTPATTGYYHCFFKPNGQGGGDNVSTTFDNTEIPYRDDANGSFGIMQTSTMYQNRVTFYSSGIVAGQTLSNRSATLPVTLLYL